MDRRNFFAAAGAASLLFGGWSANAQVPANAKFIKDMSDTFAGTQFDQDIVAIAQKAAASFDGGPHHYPKKRDVRVLFGKWCALVVVQTRSLIWTNTDEAFGADYKTLTLSKMLAVAAKSKYATPNFELMIDRDGEVFVTS